MDVMKHKVRVKNWDGETIELSVDCSSDDPAKVAKMAHATIGRMRDTRGRAYTTYCISRIDGKIPPSDVMCG